MLAHRIAPEPDTLGIFLPALRDLTLRRLDAKRRAQSQEDQPQLDIKEPQYWEGLQGSFKVLINSFYGYLGGPFYWNDYAAVRLGTGRGRELVQGIVNAVGGTRCRGNERDTDWGLF